MKPMKRGKLLQLPAVKSKKTIKGKYRAVIQILEKKNKRRRR